jgi:Tfp pilus assembly protein PilZ
MTEPRPILLLPYRNRGAFLEQYFDRGALGGLFVPGELDVGIGDQVDVEVSFAEEQVRFHIRGQVRWKRTEKRRALEAGVGIEFLETEQKTHDVLLAFAKGTDVHHKERAARRWGVQADVKVKADGRVTAAVTDDLSEGGAFLLLDEPIAVGSALELKLKAPGALTGVSLDALVLWRRADKDKRGVGVEFVFLPDDRRREKLARLVRVLKDRLVRELRVQAPRVSSTPPTTAPPTDAVAATIPEDV